MKNIPFSPPYINNEVVTQVNSVLDSGWITTGPKCIELELKIGTFISNPNVVSCNSWSSGAQIVLNFLGIGPGDEVIIPNYTYAATLLAIHHVGATPVIVDVDSNYQINLNQVGGAITNKTKGIIPVDIGGLPVDIDELKKVITDVDVKFSSSNKFHDKLGRIAIISDAAHSFGGTINNKYVGCQSDFTVFSLHAVKNLTSAEGGLITFNLPEMEATEVLEQLKLIRLNGQTKDALAKTQGLGNWEYDIVLKGYKMNMPDICAAIALGQLIDYELIRKERERVYYRYSENFKNHPDISFLPGTVLNRKSSHHLMMLSLNHKQKTYRNEIIKYCADHGVSTNVHFKPLSLMTAFQEEKISGTLKNSIELFEREISLPIYPQLSMDDVDFISKTVIDALDKFCN